MKALKTILIITMLILIGLLLFKPATPQGQKVPKEAISKLKLDKYGDKLIVLHFYANYCPSCQVEAPGLVSVWKKFKNNSKVVFIGVDVSEPKSEGQAFIKKYGFRFKNFFEEEIGPVSNFFNVDGIPTTIFIKSNRKIDEVVGRMEPSQLEQKINTYI